MEIYKTQLFEKWFARLQDRRTRTIIEKRLFRIATDGDFGDIRVISANVSELRIDYGPGYRIYLTRKGATVVLLLIGGDKDTQIRDIQIAERLAKTELTEVGR